MSNTLFPCIEKRNHPNSPEVCAVHFLVLFIFLLCGLPRAEAQQQWQIEKDGHLIDRSCQRRQRVRRRSGNR